MLTLSDAWAWDFWLADDGARFHLFYLRAPRSLGDPELRHRWAGVGHAVSTDLRTWTPLPDALVAGEPGGPDDMAIWTGCVVRGPGGTWHMFYTGATDAAARPCRSPASPPPPTSSPGPATPPTRCCVPTRAGTRCSAGAGRARTGATRGSTPTPTATAGTCSSPPADEPAPTTTAAWSARRGRRTCATGRRGRRARRPAPGSGSWRSCSVGEISDPMPVEVPPEGLRLA